MRSALSLGSLALVALLATSAGACRRSARAVVRHEKPKAQVAACMSIVSWNDLHGQLGPDDPQLDLNHVPAGGVIALADEVADARASGEPVFVLDAGDLFAGPMESSMNEGAPVMDAYRVLGVDAASIGNHEFDFGPVGYERPIAPGKTDQDGPEGPRGALLERMKSSSFPFLAANLVRQGGAPTGWPNHKPSIVISRGGFDVGVVGYTTRETPRTTLKPNVSDLDFDTGAAAAVGREIHAMRARGVSPIVLLAHASLEGELPETLDDPADKQAGGHVGEIAALLGQLDAKDLPDLVVAGHRHAWMLGRVRGVPIVSTDQHGVGYAKTRWCRADAKGAPAFVGIERRAVISSGVPRTQLGRDVAKVVAPWQAKVRAEAEQSIATLTKSCVGQGPLGTAMLEQLARATLVHANDAAKPPPHVPVVAVVNAGGLRAPFHAGVLRNADLFAAMPFENSVSVCATTRTGLARAVANLVTRATKDRFPFGVAGAKVRLVRSPTGALVVTGIVIDGDEKDPPPANVDLPVWIAMPDFLLWGGDHFLDGITCTSQATSTTRIRDAWRELLASEQSCSGPAKNVIVEIPLDRPPIALEE